ncbi:MAG TPA: choice-of-anchor tandem repeat GloVer-containing protein [Gemmatimonadales bacterium]|nr:choice-of-anchor tandem repeat GloVer-containing protein [Gemmatimonadales bacterium]
MIRSRRLAKPLVVLLVVVLAGTGAGPRPQLPPIYFAATGRVCIQKQFGAPPAGLTEPIWFLNTGAIASGADGNLYSTSPSGGTKGAGTAFQIGISGALKVLTNFAPYDTSTGSGPHSGLVDGHDGYFYGTTYGGGHFGVGTLFRIRSDQTKPEILWHFRNGSTIRLLPTCPTQLTCYWPGPLKANIAASYPIAPPVVGPGGVLYGVASYSNNQNFGALYTTSPPYDSTRFHTLCLFDQRMLADTSLAGLVCKAKGWFPNALLLGTDGNLYGTTLNGPGTSLHGTVFKATTSGDATTIHAFDGAQGSKPYNLMMASNGRLYGTTANGGDAGWGTVYRLDTSGGGFTVMSMFHVGAWGEGANPYGGLVETQPSGSVEPFLFGTTKFGGRYNRGTLFRIPLMGDSLSLRVLHDFDMVFTGRSPITPPVVGSGGGIYGLTYEGGVNGAGVLYALDPIVLNQTTTHDANLTGGTPALDDNGKAISDPIVQVFVNAQAFQPEKALSGGIRVLGRCPNAHIVQFLYRERIAPSGTAYTDMIPTVSGTYQLSDVKANQIHWNTDVPLTKLVLGPFEQRNAYLDQANGAAHYSVPGLVEIFDLPGFTPPTYLEDNQTLDPTLSETWRATARDFLVCNCRVTKEIWWSREQKGPAPRYAHIKVVDPAPDALTWINAQLKSNGFAPIP